MKTIKISAIGSTNEYLKSLVKKTYVEDGTLVMTDNQTQGKGQMGSIWYFEIGKSLAFSILKRFKEPFEHPLFYINLAVSLGVKNAIEELGIPKVTIKWPNDILADGKKIAGILVENQLQKARLNTSIIGVGVNMNNEDFPNFPQASSLLLNSGVHYSSGEVVDAIYRNILVQIERLNHDSSEMMKQEYEAALFRKGIISSFQNIQNQRFNGIIQGVTDKGLLEVLVDNKRIKQFQLKEIKLLY